MDHQPGNGFCEDYCNHPDLYFDLGDCCLDNINDAMCYDCICFEDCSRHPSEFPDNMTYATECYNPDILPYAEIQRGVTCFPGSIGDGICHGYCNNHLFYFDGGDCCLPTVISSVNFQSIVLEKCGKNEWNDCTCYEDCSRKPTLGPNLG